MRNISRERASSIFSFSGLRNNDKSPFIENRKNLCISGLSKIRFAALLLMSLISLILYCCMLFLRYYMVSSSGMRWASSTPAICGNCHTKAIVKSGFELCGFCTSALAEGAAQSPRRSVSIGRSSPGEQSNKQPPIWRSRSEIGVPHPHAAQPSLPISVWYNAGNHRHPGSKVYACRMSLVHLVSEAKLTSSITRSRC
jgi:hypothetical protein